MRPSSWFAAVVLGVATLVSGSALAQSLSVDVKSTGGTPFGESAGNPLVVQPDRSAVVPGLVNFVLSASVGAPDDGVYQNVEMKVVMPPGIQFESGGNSSFISQGCTLFNVTLPTTCTWKAATYAGTGALTRPFDLAFKAAAMRFRDGQNIVITATLSATGFVPASNPGGPAVAVTPDSDDFHAQVDTTAGLFLALGQGIPESGAARYGYGPDGATQGYIHQFFAAASTVGPAGNPIYTSNIVDDIHLELELPSGSVFTVLRLKNGVPPGWTLDPASTDSHIILDWIEGPANNWVSGVPGAAGNTPDVRYTTRQAFVVEAFAPCSRFDENTAANDVQLTGTLIANDAAGNPMPQVAGSLAPVSLAAPTTGSYGLPVWTNGVAPLNAPWCIDEPNPPAGARQAGTVQKADNDPNSNDVTAGASQIYNLDVLRPVGEPTLNDAFLVDRLPDGLWDLPGATVTTVAAGFDIYYCDFSAEPGESVPGGWVNFFPHEIDLADCATGSATAPFGAMLTPTHVVMVASTLGGSAGTAWSGLVGLRQTVNVKFPLGYVGDVPGKPGNYARNQSWFIAGYDDDGGVAPMIDLAGSLETFANEGVADGTHVAQYNTGNENNIWDVLVVNPAVTGSVDNIILRQPRAVALPVGDKLNVQALTDPPMSQRFDLIALFDGALPLVPTAPIFRVTIPAGFIHTNAPTGPIATDLKTGASAPVLTGYHSTYVNCGTGTTPTAPSIAAGPGGSTVLTWRTNPGYTLNDSINNGTYCAAVALELYADPTFGFVSGQTVTFTADLLYDNAGSDTLLDTFTLTKTLRVSAGLDFTAALACTGQGDVRVAVTVENAGGQPFTHIESRVDLPAGIDHSAVLASIAADPTLGTPLSAAFAGNTLVVTWDQGGAPLLAPFTSGVYTFDVPWTGGVLSLSAYGSVVANSEGVQTTVESTTNEVRSLDADTCPGTVTVIKHFGNTSGALMAGVSFNLDGVTQATDAGGQTVFTNVPNGVQPFSENVFSPGNADWTNDAPTTVTVPANDNVTVTVVNACTCDCGACPISGQCDTNACDDGNTCTTDACVDGGCVNTPIVCNNDNNPCSLDVCVDGSCTYPSLADGTSCDNDASACTIEECQSGTCQPVSTVDCGNSDVCTADICNPSTGACEETSTAPEVCAKGGAIVAIAVQAPNGDEMFVLCAALLPGSEDNPSQTDFNWYCLDEDGPQGHADGQPDVLTAAQAASVFGAGLCTAEPNPK